jgi:hypothetical protein
MPAPTMSLPRLLQLDSAAVTVAATAAMRSFVFLFSFELSSLTSLLFSVSASRPRPV